MTKNENDVDRRLKHKDRLAQMAANYANNDNQTLANMKLMNVRAADEPGVAPMSLCRVLLVDTSRATLEVCVSALNDLGVGEIVALQDGYEALGRLLKEPFDAVITSLRVPTIDGQTLTPVLRAIPGPNQRTPVILLTASAAALDPTAVRPDYVVEKNPHMTQRLKKILGELKGVIEHATRPAVAKIDRVLKKIVLVDDSPAIHQLLRASFKRFPEIAIATLEDPTAAVDFVRHEQPDFVLLDLNMPQLSGKEVMRDIKACADLQGIPVAFFTADESVDERAKLIDLGACHVFKKPFSPKTFAAELIRIYNERKSAARW